jgi:hypothetical protein
MKPTAEQQTFLSKYLRKNLRYRETYTEFYDHILSALESKPQTISFQDAIESIIKEDFGGYDGMFAIERRYYGMVTSEIRSKYLSYVIEYLKFPLIGVTGSIALFFYFITNQSWFGFWVFVEIIITIRFAPILLRWIRNFKLGHIFTKPQRSVKDGVFEWLDYIPVMVFLVIVIFHAFDQNSPMIWFKNAGPVVLTMILVGCALHTLSYYEVYKNEFKINITH